MSTPFFGNGFASNIGFASNRHLILISTLFRLPVIFIASASSITVNKLFFSSFVFFTVNYPRQNAEIVPFFFGSAIACKYEARAWTIADVSFGLFHTKIQARKRGAAFAYFLLKLTQEEVLDFGF
ncbi:hypothetical protein [Nostoc sp. UHCC 0251]|uniref:hypothetical protein n=1 Tax=Nostoc sp. UHCC 0251 TaxID=3110240 RepID=UPI002B211A07|nr:hypothetical protein [Nostoc sp. UHCC 0251]MEA5626974.1 hypothetical protein [Nostoc sp. UHCC 0251]